MGFSLTSKVHVKRWPSQSNTLRATRIVALVIALAGSCAAQGQGDAIPYRTMVPVSIDGRPYKLELSVHKPAGAGPFPTLVFNHGSTGYGTDPSRFTRSVENHSIAAFFVSLGWVVVFPARRGRGGSEGEYDEGFSVPRFLGYSCIPSLSLAGTQRALMDIGAAWEAVSAFPFVDPRRMVIGGQSRGGALSVAFAGTHASTVKGVINFVGGWLGSPCPTAASVNNQVFRAGAAYPGQSLWLYASGDRYYSLAQSSSAHQSFLAAGGRASFHSYEISSPSGHDLHRRPDLWGKDVLNYLQTLHGGG